MIRQSARSLATYSSKPQLSELHEAVDSGERIVAEKERMETDAPVYTSKRARHVPVPASLSDSGNV